jgi:O-antigen ligase
LLLLAGLASDDGGSALQRVVGVNDFARVYLWERALADIRAHPWLGLGPMHYALAGNPYAAHPHNSALQVAAEWGVPTLVILSALIVAVVAARWQDVRQRSATESDPSAVALVAVALCAVIAGVVDSLVSGTLVMPVSQTWWLVAAGLAMAGPRAAPRVSDGRVIFQRGLAVTIVVLHLGLAMSTFVEANKPVTGDAVGMIPRYWGNGQFHTPLNDR